MVDLKLRHVEEAEVPLEGLHEHVHHSAEHSGEIWISWVALSTAISALTKKRQFWIVSLVFGAAGCVFLVLGAIAH